MNPYAQQWGQQGGAAPSVYGALPTLATPGANADTATFTFTNFKTTILNSTIVGPGGRKMYAVETEASAPACTIFKDPEAKNAAMIQWQPNASIEIRGFGTRTRVRDWLRLASDQTCVIFFSWTNRPAPGLLLAGPGECCEWRMLTLDAPATQP